MTEISGASVFTNGGGGGGGGDLLQQAFQQVVDEDDQDNDFVTFLQSDTGDPQVIQLTAEQAAALGITFSVENDQTTEGDVSFQACNQPEQQQQHPQEQQQQTLSHEDSQRIIDELTQSGLLKANNAGNTCAALNDWNQQQNRQDESFQHETLESNLTFDTIQNTTDQANNIVDSNLKFNNVQNQESMTTKQTDNVIRIQTSQSNGFITNHEVPKSMEAQCNGNVVQNTIQFSIASNNAQVNNVSESQAQILQRFPVILPSSQFIIKPTQTVLTPVKNIRILPSNKMTTTIQSSQNSLLLPKTTLINSLSPQIIKALPIGTQFLSTTNNVSSQLLNRSRILTKNVDSSNSQLINESGNNSNVNTVTSLTQNLIRHTSVQKPAQAQIQQKGNLQQFFTPILKTNSNNITAVKNTSLLHSHLMKQNSTTSIQNHKTSLKSIQQPSQIVKTTYVKSPLISLANSKHTSTPILFRTTPVIKSEDSKLTSTSTPVRCQSSTTPVSILKPQTKTQTPIKAVANNLHKQNLASTIITQKNSLAKSLELSESIKPLVTAKLKQSVNSLMKSIKKKTIPQKPQVTVKQDQSDANKPLGSSENPIQILQQGHTYHSMQRLSQTQLKQIAQVLHQRTQESTNSNEKVVYRLVFPDEMDLRMKSPNSLLKNRGGKRGRPKKSTVRPPIVSNKPSAEEEHDDSKDDRKKIVARTRSGRLSRPPRHMVRDYKHLHHLDFMQPDLDDSDGGYSDYNTNGGVKLDDEDAGNRTELLAGLEVPKRKISDHFRCPTCSKIYLGRTRMARHFESHPDHGSPDQLPPPTVEPDLKQQTPPQDPLKRKGKKRGPWAYVTPEAKSERRQLKLREAISVCENSEIAKIAGKPVVNSLSLYDLLVLKSENNVRMFLSEIKELVERIREKTSTMLSVASNDDKLNDDVVDLNEEILCDVLALNSGFYKVNESVYNEEPESEERNSSETFELDGTAEPPLKIQRTDSTLEEGKENIEERLSSGFSESSDLSVSDFLNERRSENSTTPINCPEVLSALTLMPRNNAASPEKEDSKINNVSTVLDTGAEVQTTESPGFQKLNLKVSTKSGTGFKEGTFTKLGENLDSSCTDVFTKLNGNYDQMKAENMQRTFIKLEPTEEGFIKLANGMIGGFHQEIEDFGKIQNNGFHYVTCGSVDNYNSNKGFRKLVPKTSTVMIPNDEIKRESHEVDENSMQITTSSNNSDTNIFGTSVNLDITKMENYDHITHLDILNNSGVIDKNLMIDEKLVEHLQLVDNSNIVDELVSERLKSIMPENLLESNLLQGNGNLDTDLDFDELSEEFNRNTRS